MAEKSSPFLQLNAAPPSRRRRFSRKIGFLILLFFLVLLSAAFWHRFGRGPLLDAVIDGQRVVIDAPANGQVIEVRVMQDQLVRAGQQLLFLEMNFDADNGEASSQARLKAFEAQLLATEQMEEEAKIMLRKAALAHAKAQLALRDERRPAAGDAAAKQNYGRLQMSERKSRVELENARAALETASSARYVVASAYNQMRDALGLQGASIRRRVQHPLIVAAPIDGRLSFFEAKAGGQVQEGQTIAIIDPVLPENLWVSAFVRPSDVMQLRLGQTFRLRFPGLSDFELSGQLESIDPEPPTDEMPGIPVRLRLVDYDPLSMPALAVGQAVDVQVQ